MLSQLTKTHKGQMALINAGVSPGRRAENWRAWLSESRDASAQNRRRIQDVYYAYVLPDGPTRGTAKISGGIITEGNRVRRRGIEEAPLRIDQSPGNWHRIKAAWLRGADDDEIETLYIADVINADIDFSEFDPAEGPFTVEFV